MYRYMSVLAFRPWSYMVRVRDPTVIDNNCVIIMYLSWRINTHNITAILQRVLA